MTPEFAKHIREQQDAACHLEAIIGAVSVLPDSRRNAQDLCVNLIEEALIVARGLNRDLDEVSLPKGGAA